MREEELLAVALESDLRRAPKMTAFKFVLECDCKPEPLYESMNAYESDVMAARVAYDIWRDFFATHDAWIALESIEVEQFRAIPATSEERLLERLAFESEKPH